MMKLQLEHQPVKMLIQKVFKFIKGVIFYDEKNDQGFYLVHSIPGFPSINKDIINHKLNENHNIFG